MSCDILGAASPPFAIVQRPTATAGWLALLDTAANTGTPIAPRGLLCRELSPGTLRFPMAQPVVAVRARKLSFKYLAAEAIWITDGDDRVATIAPYNDNITKFSDDGMTFAGAYGPPYARQVSWVATQLVHDPDTRQAALVIWRPSPPPSKDIPCTLALVFHIRDGAINTHVTMRSSDIWLGVPYDIFTFTMMTCHIAWLANLLARDRRRPLVATRLGWLTLTAASSHLYERDRHAAELVIEAAMATDSIGVAQKHAPIPAAALTDEDGWPQLRAALLACRDGLPRGATIDGVEAYDWTPRPTW